MANLWARMMAWRKKKTTGETDKTREGLEQADISSKDMPTDYERTQKLTGKSEKSTAKAVADPNLSDIAAVAKAVKDWDAKRKAENARLATEEERKRKARKTVLGLK